MTKLTPAQAAVLSGDITWNSDGSVYVTTGRENTLASLRRMGMLHGSLLTTHGFNARVTMQGGSLNVVTPENGESETLFAKQYTEGESVDIMATVKGDTTETAVASVPNGNPADVNRWLDWARNTPTWTNVHAVNTPMCSEGHPIATGIKINSYGMCMNCVDIKNAERRAEYEANLAKWAAEAAARDAREAADLRAKSEAMEHTHDALLGGYNAVTDADLDKLSAMGSDMAPGPIREAEILRPLTPRVRALVRSEAHTWMNTSPGWNWSGSLEQARKNVLSGRTPALELGKKLMAYDPTGERAAEAANNGQSWETFRDDAERANELTMDDVEPLDADDDTTHAAAIVYAALYDTEDVPVTLSTVETLRDAYSSLEPGKGTHITAMVSGRIGGMRTGGKLCFATLTDATDSIQVITSADRVDPEALTEWKGIPDGSHVTLTGEVTMSKRGILSIMAESWVATEPEPTPEPELTIQLADRKGWVRVSLVGQTMEIRSGSDVRLRASLWARGLGYRLARKGSRAWQQTGKLSVARVLPA
jgi:hypothetical protein